MARRGQGPVQRHVPMDRAMVAPTTPSKRGSGPQPTGHTDAELLDGYASNLRWYFGGVLRAPRVPVTDGQREMLAVAVRMIRYEERKRRT